MTHIDRTPSLPNPPCGGRVRRLTRELFPPRRRSFPMHCARLLPLLLPLPLLMLAACGEDQSPTTPTIGGTGSPELTQTPGHVVVNSLADPGDGTCNATQCTLREAINDPEAPR